MRHNTDLEELNELLDELEVLDELIRFGPLFHHNDATTAHIFGYQRGRVDQAAKELLRALPNPELPL